MASTFTPKDGTVQEWITSVEDTITRVLVFIGKIKWWSVSNNRNCPKINSFEGVIYESNSTFMKSEYS